MGLISVTLPNDGETADAADLANPLNTIVSEINGNLDANNLAAGAVTASELASSAVTAAKIADDAVTAAKIDWASTGADAGIWWEELGRNTVSSGTTMTVSDIPARKYLKIIGTMTNTAATVFDGTFRFNNDSGANYRMSYLVGTGAAHTDTGASTSLPLESGNVQQNGISYSEIEVVNIESMAKVGQLRNANNSPSLAMSWLLGGFRWVNTSALISRVDFIASAGALGAGSELVVLGHN